jgi:hypothetical protein
MIARARPSFIIRTQLRWEITLRKRVISLMDRGAESVPCPLSISTRAPKGESAMEKWRFVYVSKRDRACFTLENVAVTAPSINSP